MTRCGTGLAAASLALTLIGAEQDRPLPDEASFLAEAKRNLVSDERLQVRYTYKLRRTEIGRNPFGHIGTGDVVLYEVYPSPVMELTYYRRVSTNGIAVSYVGLAEQDRKQREKVAAFVERLRRESAAARERQRDQAPLVARRERAMLDDVIATLDLRLERRDQVNGRPAIIVSFAPRPSARPWSSEGKLVKHFKGRVWVDETSYQLARVEAEAIDTVAFGFGFLVRLTPGARGLLTRRSMSDGVWLPAEARLQATGRALLFRRFDLEYLSEYFDYQPIDPASPPPFVALPADVTRK